MGYVAVTGGSEAIDAALSLLDQYRAGGEEELTITALRDGLRVLVDRVMGEAGLYAPDYAALALKQSEGSTDEAVFLLRAYRSTLPRNYFALPLKDMRLIRHISAAFKDIPGGQMLGPTYDYTHRLLDFSMAEPGALRDSKVELTEDSPEAPVEIYGGGVTRWLSEQGLISGEPDLEAEPFDVTENMLYFPASRSARLQTLARADTGYVDGLAYSSLRGFGSVHPTVGELHCGSFSVEVADPLGSGESLYIGEVLVTEAECYVPGSVSSDNEFDQVTIDVGYGAVFGRNDTKAISIAILDQTLEKGGDAPTADEEFVLMHGDSLEMNGFISHLKLPHYVTFQSKLDRVRSSKARTEEERKSEHTGDL